jgi:pilus assembly protein CpaC
MLLAMLGLAGMGWADEDDIKVTLGSAKVVAVKSPERVAIGNPEVADVKQISDQELLVTGKSLGSTSLIIWYAGNRKQIYSVIVTTGKAAQTMIQVDVQVMEIIDTDTLNLGLDWERIVGNAGQLNIFESTAPINAIGTLDRAKLNLLLKLMVEKGHAKILARPKLLTLSGNKASFNSGGELPVSTVNSTGQQSVEWKKYGVNLDVNPTAKDTGDIHLDIRAEVSDVDYTHLVNGNPALKTRWASSTIQVQPGSTVVIGGLIQEKTQIQHQGLPILSDIPVLGYLFKSTMTSQENSELVIFVTPYIVGRGEQK